MSNKTKWKWIAQDADGRTFFYDEEPLIKMPFGFMPNGQLKLVAKGKPNQNFRETLINLETHDYKIVDGILIRVDKEDNKSQAVKHAHYKRNVKHLDYIDVYRIIDLYELHDPCFQHALKKILVPGARGHKDLIKDINDRRRNILFERW